MRDRRLIKTGDQIISLVNVDVKIGTKAKRLEKVLPYVIHHDQNALFDAVRTVNDVMDLTEMKGCKGIMSVIDFEKAFNSLRLDLFNSLEILGFGVSLITWIKTFYKNITSCVVNNGFFTRSCQGDPSSPSLFIIVLELLAISIRNNHGTKGITVGD